MDPAPTLDTFPGLLLGWWPTAVAVVALVVAHVLVTRFLRRRQEQRQRAAFVRQWVLAGVWAVGVVGILLVLPVSDSTQGQLLGLLGILLSAAIALSSTTFLGNAIAGLVLRGQGAIQIGDFIEMDEHFGRVTELGLVQTEIQTEARTLTTLPNSLLVQSAVTTYRDSGTLISAEVSLGYDVARRKAQRTLVKAATSIELGDPFVQIIELGDFSVLYRVVGLLEDIRWIVTMRSRLRGAMIDELHGAGIEIVSPTFMNQRRVDDTPVIARREWELTRDDIDGRLPEDIMFDKAKQAETLEKLREVQVEFGERLQEADRALGQCEAGSEEHGNLLRRREKLETQRRRLEALIADKTE